MKKIKSFAVLISLFIYIVVVVCAIILKFNGVIATSWFILTWIILAPALYCLIFISIVAIRESLRQKHIIKAAAGTFRLYDMVIDPTGEHPNEPGMLIRHGAIWMIEYTDGMQAYINEPYKLLPTKGNAKL